MYTRVDAANSDMVHGLMTRAKRAHVNSCMIGTIIEDIMGFSECCLEVERDDSTFLWMCRNVVSGLQQVTMVPAYGVYKLSLDAALDYSEDIWRSVNYERTPYSSYAEMVQLLYDRIGMVRDHATTIMEMERDIDRHIPSAVRCETLTNIMRNVAAYFHRSVFEELVKGKSSGLVIVYLKIIHHSRALRMLRDSVTVVTVRNVSMRMNEPYLASLVVSYLLHRPTAIVLPLSSFRLVGKTMQERLTS